MYCINMMTCFWWASQSPACVDFYTTGKKPFSLLTFVIDGLCKKPYITFLYISVYILCKTFDANFITFRLIDRTKSEKFKRGLSVETVRWAVHQSTLIDGKLMCPNGRILDNLNSCPLQPRNSKMALCFLAKYSKFFARAYRARPKLSYNE